MTYVSPRHAALDGSRSHYENPCGGRSWRTPVWQGYAYQGVLAAKAPHSSQAPHHYRKPPQFLSTRKCLTTFAEQFAQPRPREEPHTTRGPHSNSTFQMSSALAFWFPTVLPRKALCHAGRCATSCARHAGEPEVTTCAAQTRMTTGFARETASCGGFPPETTHAQSLDRRSPKAAPG